MSCACTHSVPVLWCCRVLLLYFLLLTHGWLKEMDPRPMSTRIKMVLNEECMQQSEPKGEATPAAGGGSKGGAKRGGPSIGSSAPIIAAAVRGTVTTTVPAITAGVRGTVTTTVPAMSVSHHPQVPYDTERNAPNAWHATTSTRSYCGNHYTPAGHTTHKRVFWFNGYSTVHGVLFDTYSVAHRYIPQLMKGLRVYVHVRLLSRESSTGGEGWVGVGVTKGPSGWAHAKPHLGP